MLTKGKNYRFIGKKGLIGEHQFKYIIGRTLCYKEVAKLYNCYVLFFSNIEIPIATSLENLKYFIEVSPKIIQEEFDI